MTTITYSKAYVESPFLKKLEERLKELQKERDDHQEKNLLKRLKGEIQTMWDAKHAKPPFEEEVFHKIVRRYIDSNNETLPYLIKAGANDDATKFMEETKILEAMLPVDTRRYWSKEDIRGWVKDNKIQFTNKSSGQVIGMCMSKLRGYDVRGQDVREVIETMMAEWEQLPKGGLAPED